MRGTQLHNYDYWRDHRWNGCEYIGLQSATTRLCWTRATLWLCGERVTVHLASHPVSRPAVAQLTTLRRFSGTKSTAFGRLRLSTSIYDVPSMWTRPSCYVAGKKMRGLLPLPPFITLLFSKSLTTGQAVTESWTWCWWLEEFSTCVQPWRDSTTTCCSLCW